MARRIDQYLVEEGFFESRGKAREAIEAGNVLINGVKASKPSQKVPAGAEVSAEAAHPYVSRAGLKLAHALKVFSVNVADTLCLDIGSSTGGFTQVLIESGARHVTAVDVGRDQLHRSLRALKNVSLFEGLDARDLSREHLRYPPNVIVCDASFISLEKILARPLSLTTSEAIFIGLFKPQFQVGKANVGRGGIVRNDKAVDEAWTVFEDWLNDQSWRIEQRTNSPILGGDGNREFLFLARNYSAKTS